MKRTVRGIAAIFVVGAATLTACGGNDDQCISQLAPILEKGGFPGKSAEREAAKQCEHNRRLENLPDDKW